MKNSENKIETFDVTFWRLMIIFGGILLLIGLLPYLFTKWSVINFNQTGQIGDTIGGIMGPFVAIIGAILTFIAFWVQFKANERQFAIINKQSEKELVDGAERRFFFLIQHYFRLEEQLNNSGWTGKASFGACLEELKFIISMVSQAVTNNYKLDSNISLLKNSYKYAIIKISADLWFDGYNKDTSKKGFLTGILIDFNNLTGIGNPLDPKYLVFHEEETLTKSFNKINDYMFYRHKEGASRINTLEIHRFGIGRSNQYSAYFKSIYNILIFVNNLDSSILDYEKKKEWINFFIQLMSDEELELLAFMGLSKVLWGLEIGPKEALSYVEQIDELKFKNQVNRMIISKYKIFESYFNKTGYNIYGIQEIYQNHTIGREKELKIDITQYKNIWRK